jgi:hypothetical protein
MGRPGPDQRTWGAARPEVGTAGDGVCSPVPLIGIGIGIGVGG